MNAQQSAARGKSVRAWGTFLSIYLSRSPTLGFLFPGHEKYAEFAASLR